LFLCASPNSSYLNCMGWRHLSQASEEYRYLARLSIRIFHFVAFPWRQVVRTATSRLSREKEDF